MNQYFSEAQTIVEYRKRETYHEIYERQLKTARARYMYHTKSIVPSKYNVHIFLEDYCHMVQAMQHAMIEFEISKSRKHRHDSHATTPIKKHVFFTEIYI